MTQTNLNVDNRVPAIVVSTHMIGYGVIRALGVHGVPIHAVYFDNRDFGYVSKYVHKTLRTPHPEEDEKGFVNALSQLADPSCRSLLIPAGDACMTAISKYKQDLEKQFIVACTDWTITEKFLDKKFTYQLAESLGIPTPKTVVLHSEQDVLQQGSELQYPCVVKPCISHVFFDYFQLKMVIVENPQQAMETFLKAQKAGFEVMLQEYIPGDVTSGVNYNSYCQEQEVLLEFTAEKVRSAPTEHYLPRIVMSKEIPEIIDHSRTLLKALGFYGYSCTEYKKDSRDGIYKLMEINGRYNRSSLLSMKCGINFPWLMYQHLVHGEKPRQPRQILSNVYWIDLTQDLFKSIRFYSKERFSLIQYLRPYLRPHVFAILNCRDGKPFIKRIVVIFRIGLRNLQALLVKMTKKYKRVQLSRPRLS